jgi:UDP-N-acetylmuramoylalanine--D-glutamate ligase
MTQPLAGRRVTVLGAARSGRAAASLALRLGAEVVLTDLRADAEPLEGARCVFGHHEDADLIEADLLVVSPGVPASAPPVRRALEAGVEVVGELGFAARFVDPVIPLLAVTGTNGKSSVTHFTAQLLEAAGRRVFAGGNLGTPLSEAFGQRLDAMVVEASSYQMELPGTFAPSAAVVLNLSPDHLARHGTMEVYARHKCRVFDRLDEGGFAILPVGDELLERCARGRGGRRLWLGAQPGVTVAGDMLVLGEDRLDLRALRLLGEHNRWNAGAACLLALSAGLAVEEIDLSVLTALPHRLQPVPSDDGLRWVNDSKATNVDAGCVGISSVPEGSIVLLGGQPKEGSDYSRLPVQGHTVLAFGAAGPEIHAALGGELFGSLREAVDRASELARPGQTVLLACACSSFDEFDNFEQRGELFMSWVQQMSTNEEAP